MDKKTIFLIGIVAVLGLLSFAVDNNVVRFFADLRTPILNDFMILVTDWLTVAVVAILIPVLLLWAWGKKKWVPPLVLSVVVAVGLTYLFKSVFAVLRPELGLIAAAGFSFPSGHTATVFSVTPVLNRGFPKLKWFWVGFACLIGFTRLYLGVHYLSDIIFGGLLGYLVGLSIIYLGAEKWEKWK
ncbi:MAG: phosphatase PAP2 family protein [Candidatus Hadarchaeaceae archaeon]|nr:phosphatase PAP2 family protein [Hadesarchaea archaeon]